MNWIYYYHYYADEMSRVDVLMLYKPLKNNLIQAQQRSEPTYNQVYVQTEVDDSNLKVDNITLEKGYQFKYFGVSIIIHEEIKNRLTSTNKCYYSL